jgi:trk system potassium uptake protein TrkH
VSLAPTYTHTGPLQGVLSVLNVLSGVLMLFSATMLVPLAVSLLYQDAAIYAYDEAVAITLGTGVLLWALTRNAARELQTKDGFLLVFLVATVVPIFAALPFMFYMPRLSFTHAYFESMAGITTTGATVLANLDKLPPSIHVWRGLLQWLGGMAIIVLAVAILPLLRVGGRQLYKADSPGPIKDTKLTPRMRETAKWLWIVYIALTAACVLCYYVAGMNLFDAVVHAFATLSLGGFSTHDASFSHFDSPAIEAVAVVFMLIAGLNFSTHFTALQRRSLQPYRADPEARWFLIAAIGSSLAIALFLWQTHVYAMDSALRYAIFNTVSIATTTGFVNVDYNAWPAFAPLWMLLLSGTISSAGSPGGGIKMIRTELLVLQGWREMVKLLHPQAQVPVKLGGYVISNQIVFAVLAFMSLYGASVTVMTLLLLASGLDFVTAFTAIVASITCTGPGLNEVGPAMNYAGLTPFQTWVCAIAMLLGRLELFTVLVLFTPAFWRR